MWQQKDSFLLKNSSSMEISLIDGASGRKSLIFIFLYVHESKSKPDEVKTVSLLSVIGAKPKEIYNIYYTFTFQDKEIL